MAVNAICIICALKDECDPSPPERVSWHHLVANKCILQFIAVALCQLGSLVKDQEPPLVSLYLVCKNVPSFILVNRLELQCVTVVLTRLAERTLTRLQLRLQTETCSRGLQYSGRHTQVSCIF